MQKWDAPVADFPNMGKSYAKLAPNLRGFVVDDYIVFYYPKEDGINITRVVSDYRDLESLFTDLDNEWIIGSFEWRSEGVRSEDYGECG